MLDERPDDITPFDLATAKLFSDFPDVFKFWRGPVCTRTAGLQTVGGVFSAREATVTAIGSFAQASTVGGVHAPMCKINGSWWFL